MKPDFSNKIVSSSNGTLQRQSSLPTNVVNLSEELHKTIHVECKTSDYPVCCCWWYVPFSGVYSLNILFILSYSIDVWDSLLLHDSSPSLPYNSHITVHATFNRQQNIQKYFFHSTGTVSREATQTQSAWLVNLTPVARFDFFFILHSTWLLLIWIKPLCHEIWHIGTHIKCMNLSSHGYLLPG